MGCKGLDDCLQRPAKKKHFCMVALWKNVKTIWSLDKCTDQTTNAWFPPFRCRSAVSPFPLHKFRKNYVSAIITLLTWKILLRRCRFHLPLRRNRRSDQILFLPFCHKWTTNQRSGHFIPMYTERRFQHFRSHPAMATVATERKNGNGTT